MSKTAQRRDTAKKRKSNVKEYLAEHPTLHIVGQQPDFIEPMDTPEKLKLYRELLATSIAKIPSLGYTDSTGDGQTGTFSYVGDKPVVVDHDSERD